MEKFNLSKDPMTESLVSDGESGKKAVKEFTKFVGILTLISSAIAIVKTYIHIPGVDEPIEELIKNGIAILLSFLSSFLTKLVIDLFANHKRIKWIKSKRKCWIRGTWLHTHVKENGSIRVGYVVIKQHYDLIEAKGHNVSLEEDPNKKKWEYLTGKVFPGAKDDDDIVCSFVNRKHGRIENTGTHTFKSIEGSDGFPVRLEGEFKDTVTDKLKKAMIQAEDNHEVAVKMDEHYGTVYLYRASPELLKELTKKNEKEPSLDKIRDFVLKKKYQLDKFKDEQFSSGIEGALRKSEEKKKQYN